MVNRYWTHLGTALCAATLSCVRTADAAPVSAADIEAWLNTTDLLHEEYRTDLAKAQLEVAAFSTATGGKAQALAKLAEARVHRLRGRYKSAATSLEEARNTPGAETQTRVRIAVERRLLANDSWRAPWGPLDVTNDDLNCLYPARELDVGELISNIDDEISQFSAAPSLDSVGKSTAQSFGAWAEAAVSRGKSWDLFITAHRNDNLRAQIPGLFSFLDESSKTADQAMKLSTAIPGDRARLLKARLIAPVLPAANHLNDIPAYLTCGAKPATSSDPSLRGIEGLLCVEIGLFPGTAPESLGYMIGTPKYDDTTFESASQYWSGELEPKTASQPERKRLIGLLGTVELEMRSAGNHRGLARAAFIRVALKVAQELDGVPEDGVEQALQAASEAAVTSGDDILVRRGLLLAAIHQGFIRYRTGALIQLAALKNSTRAQGDWGMAFYSGRLLASISSKEAFVKNDSSRAEVFADMALDVLESVDAWSDSAAIYRRKARLLEVGGALSGAASALREGLARIPAERCPSGSSIRPLVRRSFLQSNLISTLQDIGDHEGAAKAIADYRSTLLLLSEGTADRHQLEQRLNEAKNAEKLARSVANEVAAKSLAESDPDKKAILHRTWNEKEKLWREAADRTLAAVTAANGFSLLDQDAASAARYRERAAIVSNPDLPPSARYMETEQAAIRTNDARSQALVASRRGDYARARTIWLTRIEGTSDDVLARTASVPAGATGQEARFAVDDLAVDAIVLSRLHAYDLAALRLKRVEALTGSASWYLNLQAPWEQARTYVDVEAGLGHFDESLRVAREMLDRVEQRREGIFDERFRATQLDGAGAIGLYAVAVEAAAAAGRADDAFEFMERGKAGRLRDMLAADPRDNPDLRQVGQGVALLQGIYAEHQCATTKSELCIRVERELLQRTASYDRMIAQAGVVRSSYTNASFAGAAKRVSDALPEGTALLSYATGADYMVVVALRKGKNPLLVRTAVKPEVVEGRVSNMSSSLQRKAADSEIDRHAEPLSEWMLPKAVLDMLQQANTRSLVMVPHGVLHEVPFAYLPYQGKRLVEQFDIRVLPYAGLLLSGTQAPSTSLLTAAVLTYDGDQSPLRLARKEATTIAGLYKVANTAGATRAQFLDALHRASIVHLSAHGISATKAGGYASIDLQTTGPSDNGDVLVSDILFDREPIVSSTVVLASCELGVGRRTFGDDAIGIPRSLLQKGAGTVVAPIWRIDDAPEVIEIMADFHRGLLAGNSASQALANAQRKAIKAGKSGGYWAGFLALGGAR